MVFQEALNVNTKRHHEMQDLTSKVAHVVERSGIQTGTVHIFNLGSTASIGTIEFEPGCIFVCYYGQEADGITCVQGTYVTLR